MSQPGAQLDHVIILLPYRDITNPPSWVTDNFIVSPGGRHADNKTENRLILFADGTYVELIAFIDDDPEKRKGHWWDKPYGIVDFALGSHGHFDYPALQKRLQASGTGISYAEPQEGGRTMPDGQELKWKVTFPLGAARGEVPFWCHDITPRERRVPVTGENTAHPCGATGMASVSAGAAADKLESLRAAYAAITEERHGRVGTPLKPAGVRTDASVGLHDVDGGEGGPRIQLTLRLPEGSRDEIRERVGNGTVVIGFEA